MIQVITVLSWVFNYVYVLTSGGPGYASSVMELYIWRSFSNGANGTAASVAVMLLGHGDACSSGCRCGCGAGRRRREGGDRRTARRDASAQHAFLVIICLAALYPL